MINTLNTKKWNKQSMMSNHVTQSWVVLHLVPAGDYWLVWHWSYSQTISFLWAFFKFWKDFSFFMIIVKFNANNYLVSRSPIASFISQLRKRKKEKEKGNYFIKFELNYADNIQTTVPINIPQICEQRAYLIWI